MTTDENPIPLPRPEAHQNGDDADPASRLRQGRVVSILRGLSEPLFGLYDAARDARVLEILRGGAGDYRCLYQGKSEEEMGEFAPYLVRLPADSDLISAMVSAGWGDSWGVYLTSRAGLAEVRQHLRRFVMVQLPDGKSAYFRFYDPRVLRTFLPTCTAEEAGQFLGVLSSILVEDEDGGAIIEFRPGPGGLQRLEHPLEG